MIEEYNSTNKWKNTMVLLPDPRGSAFDHDYVEANIVDTHVGINSDPQCVSDAAVLIENPSLKWYVLINTETKSVER